VLVFDQSFDVVTVPIWRWKMNKTSTDYGESTEICAMPIGPAICTLDHDNVLSERGISKVGL